jgi:hypothetical protein
VAVVVAAARADEADDLKAAIEQRQQYIDTFVEGGPSVRAAVRRQAVLSVLSEEAIKAQAAKESITASDAEVATFLEAPLAEQGLIDLTAKPDLQRDPNIQTWLAAQHLKPDYLMRSGRTLVLWTKLAIKDTTVTSEEVRSYTEKNPQTHLLPERVKITLTRYKDASKSSTRGLSPFEGIAPRMSFVLARGVAESGKSVPKDWNSLSLYLNLDDLDPNLREALAGKKPGDSFGPVIMQNGGLIEGRVDAILPRADLSRTPEFWQMAAIRARLAKSNQTELYKTVVSRYLSVQTPAVRGIFDDAFSWVKDNLSTVGTVAGAGIGLFVGGPEGAMKGAEIGNQVGNTLQGWVNGNPPTLQSISGLAQAAGVSLPAGFNLPPLPPLPPAPTSRMANYIQGPTSIMPPAPNYRPSPTVSWAPSYNEPVWSGAPMSFIPPPMPGYSAYYQTRLWGFPSSPPPASMWAPPMFMPPGPYSFTF